MPPDRPSLGDWLKSLPLYVLPHHAISRLTFAATRLRTPLKDPVVRWFIRRYGVNMDEALSADLRDYASFNDFFTRALKPGVRSIAEGPGCIASPADSTVSQLGPITEGRIVQAKGRDYSVYELLGGSKSRAAPFMDGQFITLYLSPRDYHRVHMPLDGTLRETVYVPGRLFSVAPHTTRTIPKLFARNERLACLFDTELGPMALILVGAINVGAIETTWAGLVTPPAGRQVRITPYDETHPLRLKRGQEMGRFNLGSTVILLFGEKALSWEARLRTGEPVRMGEALAQRK